MTQSPDIDAELKSARLQQRTDQAHNNSMHLQILGITSFGLGGVYREITKLKDKLLPPEKVSWWSWGQGNKWNKVPAAILMILGGASFVFGLVGESKAKQKRQEALNTTPDPATLPLQISGLPCEGMHVARYQKEVSTNVKTL